MEKLRELGEQCKNSVQLGWLGIWHVLLRGLHVAACWHFALHLLSQDGRILLC